MKQVGVKRKFIYILAPSITRKYLLQTDMYSFKERIPWFEINDHLPRFDTFEGDMIKVNGENVNE